MRSVKEFIHDFSRRFEDILKRITIFPENDAEDANDEVSVLFIGGRHI